MIELFSDELVKWCVAAGTVVRGSSGLFGRVLKGGKNNTWFVVSTCSLCGMSVGSVHDTMELKKGNQNTTISEILAEKEENPTIYCVVVQLKHLGKGAKEFTSQRSWFSAHLYVWIARQRK